MGSAFPLPFTSGGFEMGVRKAGKLTTRIAQEVRKVGRSEGFVAV